MVVNLKKINIPFLNSVAEHDDLVEPNSSMALNNILTESHDKNLLVFKSWHVGLMIKKRLIKSYGQRWENG